MTRSAALVVFEWSGGLVEFGPARLHCHRDTILVDWVWLPDGKSPHRKRHHPLAAALLSRGILGAYQGEALALALQVFARPFAFKRTPLYDPVANTLEDHGFARFYLYHTRGTGPRPTPAELLRDFPAPVASGKVDR